MKTISSSSMMLFPFALLLLLSAAAAAAAPSLAQPRPSWMPSFDFFYIVQQWQGGYCGKNESCCYPTTGRPNADFGIHGFWPNYNNGSYPSNCDPTHKLDPEEISDLIPDLEQYWPNLACPSSDSSKLWEHEWKKHGTCSKFSQHKYFEAALQLKLQVVSLLRILVVAGITPGEVYSLNSITNAITEELGFTPGITCKVDASGKSQLHQIYLCVDAWGRNLIKCPVLPKSLSQKKCASQVEFPYYYEAGDLIRDEISMVVSN